MSVGGGSERARALGSRVTRNEKRGGKAKTNASRRPSEGTAEKQTFGNRRRRARRRRGAIRRAWIDRGGGGVGRGTHRRRAFSRRRRAPRSLPPSTPRTPCAGWAWPWSAASWPAVAEARGMWEGCEQTNQISAACCRGADARAGRVRVEAAPSPVELGVSRATLGARAIGSDRPRGAARRRGSRESRNFFQELREKRASFFDACVGARRGAGEARTAALPLPLFLFFATISSTAPSL